MAICIPVTYTNILRLKKTKQTQRWGQLINWFQYWYFSEQYRPDKIRFYDYSTNVLSLGEQSYSRAPKMNLQLLELSWPITVLEIVANTQSFPGINNVLLYKLRYSFQILLYNLPSIKCRHNHEQRYNNPGGSARVRISNLTNSINEGEGGANSRK